MDCNILLGTLIPFAGTTLGAAMVFFLRGEMNERLQKALLGFASGVMIAASVWSLLIPAIEMSRAGSHGFRQQSDFYWEWDFYFCWMR